eukprot:1137780-Pelagomonas_calceolata.AAC.1
MGMGLVSKLNGILVVQPQLLKLVEGAEEPVPSGKSQSGIAHDTFLGTPTRHSMPCSRSISFRQASIPIRDEPQLPLLRALTQKPRPMWCLLVCIPLIVGSVHLRLPNLSQFVVYLRSRRLSYWNQFTAPDPRVNNSKQLTCHQWCALPVRDLHATHPPYTMPKHVYLDLPHHVLHNPARFRLRIHTL